ncbi:quinoprotein relay system zinc metallohydrolase 1 [Methyloversatilis sp. MC4-4]|uniref:quinoprotein relay system zinc metallohydrolase 1 n=1 Tax=Methyloversatilis sp. MC4-4 TaxID=3132824 RepID=UPI003CF45CA0
MMARLLAALLAFALSFAAYAATPFDYRLKPEKIADDTWVLIGSTEDITRGNGGNIVNTAFVVTKEGVVVIDSGPSRRYGEQMRAAIARVTDKPVVRVFNTHHHPDHFLGNQAYADVPIAALPATRAGERDDGGAFADNMYRMAGDWASGTEPQVAQQDVKPGRLTVGGHEFELIALEGHTAGDLAILDHRTGVLFAGDLVFLDRAPTTPHASVQRWLKSLDALAALGAKKTLPGHGPVHAGSAGIEQTRDWLKWLDQTLMQSAANGLDMAEVMRLPLPERFERMPLARSEFERSVTHLYGAYELRALDSVALPVLQQK